MRLCRGLAGACSRTRSSLAYGLDGAGLLVLSILLAVPAAAAKPAHDACVAVAEATGLTAEGVVSRLRGRLSDELSLRVGCLDPALEASPWQVHVATSQPDVLALDLRGPGLLERRQLQVAGLGRDDIERLLAVTIAEAVRDAVTALAPTVPPPDEPVTLEAPAEAEATTPPPAPRPVDLWFLGVELGARGRLPARDMVGEAGVTALWRRHSWGLELRLGGYWPRRFETAQGDLTAVELDSGLGVSWLAWNLQVILGLTGRLALLALGGPKGAPARWRFDPGLAFDVATIVWKGGAHGALAVRLHMGLFPSGARVTVGGQTTLEQALAEGGLGLQFLFGSTGF